MLLSGFAKFLSPKRSSWESVVVSFIERSGFGFQKKKTKKKGTISRQLAYGGSGTDRFMSTLVVEVLIDKTRAQKRAIKAISMLAFS